MEWSEEDLGNAVPEPRAGSGSDRQVPTRPTSPGAQLQTPVPAAGGSSSGAAVPARRRGHDAPRQLTGDR